MPTAIHLFSQEEIMAYLDGELSPERALAVAQHLELCRECQHLAARFRSLSQSLAGWTTEPSASTLPQIAPDPRKQPRRSVWSQRWLWASASVAALAWLLISRESVKRDVIFRPSYEADSQTRSLRQTLMDRASGVVGGVLTSVPGAAAPAPPLLPQASGPLIVRTAQLAVTTRNFDQTRADVERITRAHQGYLAELNLTAPTGEGRTLSAGLRVPASQLDRILQELKQLGRVDSESQGAEDVTQHYVDVDARLSNLRTTEARLLQMLRDHTGKLADVLQVEEAVDRTRGEIETTEAEQKVLSTRIALAAVNLTANEEYKTPLGGNDGSTLTHLRNAAVAGYRGAIAGVIAVLAFLLSAAPSLLLVAAVAFFPARWVWRRSRQGRPLIGG